MYTNGEVHDRQEVGDCLLTMCRLMSRRESTQREERKTAGGGGGGGDRSSRRASWSYGDRLLGKKEAPPTLGVTLTGLCKRTRQFL